MRYFASIENTSYMRWQLRLLYESMRMLGIEKSLFVAVCDNAFENPEKIDFCETFQHQNIGTNFDYPPINKPFGLMLAVTGDLIKPPFTVIDPDMIFVKPVPIIDSDIASQHVWHMTLDYLENEVGWYFLKALGVEEARKEWKPVGCVYQFNKASKSLFEEFYYCCADLLAIFKPHLKQLKIDRAYWVREMLAFAVPLATMKQNCKVVNCFQMPLDPKLEAAFTDSTDAALIHYCGSFKPFFDKHKFHPGHAEFGGNPNEVISEIPTQNYRVAFLKKVVKSALDPRKAVQPRKLKDSKEFYQGFKNEQ